MPIQLVGYRTYYSSSFAAYTLPLTGLTGGIGTVPALDDVIVVVSATNAPADVNLGVDDTSLSWSELGEVYRYGTAVRSASMSVSIARNLLSIPPTGVLIKSSTAGSQYGILAVLRGVDVNAIDVAIAMNSSLGAIINPPPVTPVTDNAFVLTGAFQQEGGSGTPHFTAAPTGFSGFVSVGTDATTNRSASLVLAYQANNAKNVIVNPDSFSHSTGLVGSNSTGAAFTLALRELGAVAPAGGQIKAWSGTGWNAKPVMVWNGTAWVKKPLKWWNGTAWVTTPY